MKGPKSSVLNVAEKCKNILASNWQGNLNTIKADSKGSKQHIYTSRVKYLVRRGEPYIWIPEKDLHNLDSAHKYDEWFYNYGILHVLEFKKSSQENAVIDERASFAVASPYPGLLANLLRTMKKSPCRIALTGEVVPLRDEKVLSATESLRETVLFEKKAMAEASYVVSGILSSTFGTSRSENLLEFLDTGEDYLVYKFSISSCMFIGGNGGMLEVNLEDLEKSKADKLSPFSAKLIDGINRSEIRRRALVIFCYAYLNTNARDAYMLSVDRKGFDVLGKVHTGQDYHWKELRFTFKEEAQDIESFCSQLVEMEEEVLKNFKSCSGLG